MYKRSLGRNYHVFPLFSNRSPSLPASLSSAGLHGSRRRCPGRPAGLWMPNWCPWSYFTYRSPFCASNRFAVRHCCCNRVDGVQPVRTVTGPALVLAVIVSTFFSGPIFPRRFSSTATSPRATSSKASVRCTHTSPHNSVLCAGPRRSNRNRFKRSTRVQRKQINVRRFADRIYGNETLKTTCARTD